MCRKCYKRFQFAISRSKATFYKEIGKKVPTNFVRCNEKKYNHSNELLIMARTRNNSLQLIIDERGLKVRAELIDTTQNRDIYKMIQARLLTKMSFAFIVSEEEVDYETNTRRILRIEKLFDVSVVDVPAYESTEIYARNKEQYEEEKEQYQAGKLELEKEKLTLLLSL